MDFITKADLIEKLKALPDEAMICLGYDDEIEDLIKEEWLENPLTEWILETEDIGVVAFPIDGYNELENLFKENNSPIVEVGSDVNVDELLDDIDTMDSITINFHK